jgi:aspartyl-tRNA(Asn)/glutamyl-tRNA(Gln) amidotransferase subunit A
MPGSFTIAETARLLEAKVLSPVELVRACLARIDAVDRTLNAFITVDAERALAAAARAEEQYMAGGPHGALLGIPLAFKDNIDTASIRTTAHSAQLADNVPERNATVVDRLADAGSIMLGKLALHEFALAGPSFDLPWPPARNPWRPEHFAGGSSSGSAVAVAAGMVPGAVGTDSGGSIRGPAALCGVVGLKPTYGLVSRAGVFPTAFSLDHVGPLAWTVEDCAILLQAMAGPDSRDPTSVRRPHENYRALLGQPLRGLRIGVAWHFFERDGLVSEAVRDGVVRAAETLRSLGAELWPVTLPSLGEWKAVGTITLLAEAFAVHEERLLSHPERFGVVMREHLTLGAEISAGAYLQAQQRRRILCAALDQAMMDVDVLLGVTQASEAPRLDAVAPWRSIEAVSHTMPFNLSGYPALSVYAGAGRDGLPVAVQLAARPFDEARLFQVAHAYEQASGGRDRPLLPSDRTATG